MNRVQTLITITLGVVPYSDFFLKGGSYATR